MYTIANNTWFSEPLDHGKGRLVFPGGPAAATDPNTGLVYIPRARNVNGTLEVFVYDPSLKAAAPNLKMFPSGETVSFQFVFAWNAYRGSMIFFGRDTYILDVTTFTWSAGPSAPQVRASMACASAGDYFVAWGGHVDNRYTETSGSILYFNFVTNQWVDEALINSNTTATTTFISTTTPSSPPEPNLNQESPANNATAIGGGIAGAIVLGVIIGILVARHRRRSGNSPSIDNTSTGYSYGKQELPYADESDSPTSGLSPNKDPQWNNPTNNPQWNNPNNNHSTSASHPATGNDPQDAFQTPMQVYDALPAPHKYLLNQYKSPQHVSPFVFTNIQSNLYQQQQQQQQQHQGELAWSGAPQDTSESAISPVEDPAEQLALMKAMHEQRLERIRQEREADLQRFRERWQTDIPGKAEL
ncbi:hypothetical protein BGX29_003601 [Mortierella sp. GBA35]|nr:hypothetical protein BGX29_003601 [Mortierella sp. GBA35]